MDPGEGASEFAAGSLCIWNINPQGLRSKVEQLEARILLAERRPQILCLNETVLDASVGEVSITNFILVARRDRNSEGGGVCIYVASEVAVIPGYWGGLIIHF